LLAEEEAERARRLQDIEEAYAALLEPLPSYREDLAQLESADFKAWSEKPKAELREKIKAARNDYKNRVKELQRTIKELEKLREARDRAEAEVNDHANREVAHLKEAAADLRRICSDPEEAQRYFCVADYIEIEENELNLNLPRYVDTFEPEEEIPLDQALNDLSDAKRKADCALGKLNRFISSLSEA
jgi:type I restriction enzyme M protein